MSEQEANDMLKARLKCLELDSDIEGCDCNCNECEYCYTQGKIGEQKEALKIAIKSLEKQIPKKPNKHEEDILGEYHSCPTCLNNELDDIFDNYCPRCGQKLDWSKEE